MGSADVTLRTLALGSQDAVTGWYAPDRSTTSTIQMVIVPKGTVFHLLGIGYYAQHPFTGFTDGAVVEGDEILDAANRYYEIKTIQPHYWLDSLVFYECNLEYLPLHADRPATSGTWPSVGDPAYRVKTELTTYPPTGIKEDDNATDATYILAMGQPDYPIYPVFITKGVDLIFSIQRSRSTPAHIGYDKIVTHYDEETPISIMAIDKSGITARRLVWAGEAEVRRVFETNPIGTGSVRTYASGRENFQSLGSTMLYNLEVTVKWVRDVT